MGVQNIQIWPAKVLIEIRPTLAQPKCALRERRGMVTECDGLVGGESAGCRLSRDFWEYEAYLYEFKTNPVPGRPGATAGDQGPC